MLTENNLLANVKESRLGASQVHWLNELDFFDFDIKYRSGETNLVANTLFHHPSNLTE